MHLKEALIRKQAGFGETMMRPVNWALDLPGKAIERATAPTIEKARTEADDAIAAAVEQAAQERLKWMRDIDRRLYGIGNYAGAGAAAGAGLGAVITWLAAKNPKWRDYLLGAGAGAAAGGVAGGLLGAREVSQA